MADTNGYVSAAKEKLRDVKDKVVETVDAVYGKVTGAEVVRKTEEFHREMEAVYSAMVTRVVVAEKRIEFLERRLKWVYGFCIASLALAIGALILWLAR